MSGSPPIPEKNYRLPIRRPVTTAMLFLTLVVFGWKSYQQLPINLMPDISYPTLTVRTEFEGAAPEDVEKLVTRPLEETLSIVGGLVEISSISSPGLSEIILEFTWDSDMNIAQQDVRDRLDLFDPPKGVTEKPVILRYDPTLDPVLRVAITGNEPVAYPDESMRLDRSRRELIEIREGAERYVKSDLEAEAGIAQVLVKGGREEEIQVLVDSGRIKSLGLSLEDVVNSLAQQNVNLSGGRLREGKSEYLVRTLNEFEDIAKIQKSIVSSPRGEQVRLADVAKVQMGERDPETIVRINGQEAVTLEMFKEGDANTVQVCNKVKDLLGFERPRTFSELVVEFITKAQRTRRGLQRREEVLRIRELSKTLTARLPDYARLTLVSDQSHFIIGSIKEVQRAALVGGVLALAVLFFFLREVKSTLIIGIAIPISVIATFIPMFMRGISLNIMSLGGIGLGIGMLVDNSIVVLESIFRCQEEGDTRIDAAERGTQEVAGAVTASTLTTIAVFFPIAFVEGVAGQLFRDLALTVTFSLLASLLVALYLIPMIASRQKRALTGGQGVIWLLRAYREAHNPSGHGRLRAALQVLPKGFAYSAQWFKETATRTFQPALDQLLPISKGDGAPTSRSLARRAGAVIGLPFLSFLFVLHVALKGISTTLTTLFFLAGLVLMGLARLLGGLCGLVLWIPVKAFDVGLRGVRETYGVLLRRALQFSPAILVLVAALAIHAGMLVPTLGRELIPPLKQGQFGIRLEAPPGTRLEETERRARDVEALALNVPEIETVAVEVGMAEAKARGNQGDNVAQFTIRLKDPERSSQHQDTVIERLRRQIAAISSEEVTFTLPALFSFKNAIELQIRGDDLAQLKELGRRILEAVGDVKGLKDAELSVRQGYPEIIVELDRDKLAAKNISPEQVAQRLRTEVQGEVATRFSRSGDKIDIRVRSDRDRLRSLHDFGMLSVVDGSPPIPLVDVARLTVQEGPSEIRRNDQQRVAVITANIGGRDLGAVSRDLMERVQQVEKPKDYTFLLGGQNRELQISYNSLQFALLLAIFLVYVVMACQFESVWHPALIMFSVPLALIGVIYVLHWLGIHLSIVVFIGGIILAGIVVNDAIVLVDYVNQLRARGLSKRDAVVEAGRIRFRPILMTTLTTVLGLIPMALWTGEGAEIRRPMAITVMAGLTASTLLTLFIIPMIYDLFGGRDTQ